MQKVPLIHILDNPNSSGSYTYNDQDIASTGQNEIMCIEQEVYSMNDSTFKDAIWHEYFLLSF